MIVAPARAAAERLQWLLWLALLIALSYKLKVLGEPAVRPLYMLGVAGGTAMAVALAGRAFANHRLAWRDPTDLGIIGGLLLLSAYVVLQSLAYPDSFNDVVYAVATVVLVLAVSMATALAWGWQASALALSRAMLHYCTLNVVLLAASVLYPPLVAGLLVTPLESGFGIRPSGLPGDPTHLGAAIGLSLLFLFALRQRVRLRVVLLLALLVITGSRNAILSLAIGCIAAASTERRVAAAMVKTIAAAVLLAAVVVGVALLDPEAAEFMAAVFRFDDPNAYSRFGIWRDMLDLVGQMTWLEWSAGGGYLYIQAIYGSPYNAFLRIFFGHGLLGLGAFCLITLLVFVRAATDPVLPRRRLAVGLLAFWFTFSMFLDTAYAEFFHFAELCFWFAVALVLTRSIETLPPQPGTAAPAHRSPA